MKNNIFLTIKNFILENIRQSRIKFFVTLFICIVALLTGIIVAIRSSTSIGQLSGYGIVNMSNGMISSSFFTRLLSLMLIMLMLFGCSFTIYTFPLAVLLLGYRAYLLGLNLCLMFIVFGLPGMIVSVLIALPCQLICMTILIFYFTLCSKTTCDIRGFGGCQYRRQRMKISLLAFVCLFLCNSVESILIIIFHASVILVI